MQMIPCSQCGKLCSEYDFVETIEEFLCANCACGIDDDWDEDHETDEDYE